MRTLWIVLTVVVLGGLIQYILYINGYLVIKSIAAVVFWGSARRWRTRPAAKVRSCSGWVKKVLKFKESREYQFALDLQVSKGSISVEVQNRYKEPVLVLDSENPQGVLAVDCGERYYLVVRFKKATGSFELTWS